MDNDAQLKELILKAEKIASDFNGSNASNAAVAELAQIVADLTDIVHAHIYRNDDPGQS